MVLLCQSSKSESEIEVHDDDLNKLSAGVSADIIQSVEKNLTKQYTTPAPVQTPSADVTTKEPLETTTPSPDKASSEAIWTGWAYFESGDDCWKQVGGDGGNAYGRFQLDARHSLAAFLRYAAESNPDFVGLERYYRKSGNATTLRDVEGLDHDWIWLCAVYGEEFYRAQAEFAYGTFYCLMRDGLLSKYQIDLNEYGPVLKGTVWSVAVRNGNNLSSIYSVIDTYYPGIPEEEWLRAIYAMEEWRHPDQVKRWGGSQLNAALKTLTMLESGVEIEFCRTFDDDAWLDQTKIELLALEGDYQDFVRYTGRIFD